MTNTVLTDKQKAFLEALFGEAEGNIRKAMDSAGYSPTSSSALLLKSLRTEIIEGSEMILAQYAPMAAMTYGSVMSNPTSLGAEKKMMAANQVLDRIGIVKRDKIEIRAEVLSPVAFLPEKKRE
jgi:hypothetical protein